MKRIMIEISDDDYEGIKKGMRYKDTIADIMQQIEDAKPALSSSEKPKMGKWEWIFDVSEETPVSPEEIEYDGWGCSICRNPPDDICDWDDPNDPPTHKYCPNCGAKMENEI